MTRINWAELMAVGLGELRLKPDEFWALTPAELMIMVSGGQAVSSRHLDRAGLRSLIERFPDKSKDTYDNDNSNTSRS